MAGRHFCTLGLVLDWEDLLLGAMWHGVLWWEWGCCGSVGALHSLVMPPEDISRSLELLVCRPAGGWRTETSSC